MKLSQTTLLAILATSSFVAAAPTVVTDSSLVVKREDANEVLDLLKELKSLNAKREFLEGDEALELSKRADDVIVNFVSALTSSGLLSEVWNDLANNSEVKSEIVSTVKASIQGAIVHGPALIKAIWDSGLLSDVLKKFLNDKNLRTAFFALGKSLFESGENLLKSWKNRKFGSTSSDTPTATSLSLSDTATVAVSDIPDPTGSTVTKRDDILDKRDVASLVSTVVEEIKNSGILQSLVNKVLADPQKAISLLTTVFKKGLVLAEDVYNWAKSNGLLEEGLQYLEKHTGKVGTIVADILGPEIESGNVSTSDIDNASSSAAATTVATTALPDATTVETAVVTDVSTTLIKVKRAYH